MSNSPFFFFFLCCLLGSVRALLKAIRFSTAFGRGLDYYTGFEFELHRRGNGAEPLVGGGRYDGLLTRLGAREPIPAVGFSIWIEALSQGSAS